LAPLVGFGSLQFTNGSEGKIRRDKYDQHFTTEACENYVEDLLKVGTVNASNFGPPLKFGLEFSSEGLAIIKTRLMET
jgi:hypothetical protein